MREWGRENSDRFHSRRKRESKPAPLKPKGAAPPKKKSAAQIPATLPKRIKKKKDPPLLETNPQGWGTRRGGGAVGRTMRERGRENSDRFHSRRKRESKPAPLKPKGVASPKKVSAAQIPPMVSAPPVRRKRESKPAPLESKGAAPPKKESAAQIPATLPKRIKKRKDRPLLETNPQGWGTRAERRGEAWVVTSRFGLWRGWGEVRILVRRLLT
jgi:hypothetical protein